jgi:hypothetical protein
MARPLLLSEPVYLPLMTSSELPPVSRTVAVAAPARPVWELVSDLPRMGEFSPENVGGRWIGGATGPAVGVRFAGRNGSGLRRWGTTCTVTRCEPGPVFAFTVSSIGLPVAEWAYEVVDDGDGCRLTESWYDRRGSLITLRGDW